MNKAFTLIEVLIMVMITSILAGIIITYSHVGEKQIALFRDQAQVISVLNKAKSLAIQMSSPEIMGEIDVCGYGYGVNVDFCGYGVHFENGGQTYLIFKDLKPSCDNIYNGGSGEKLEEYKLDSRLKFETSLENVKFIPPDPKTKLNDSDITEEIITIRTKESPRSDVKIKITNAGQITVPSTSGYGYGVN